MTAHRETSVIPQRIIGLTGGIASGKSSVARYLQHQYHLPLSDADRHARTAVELGSPILQSIQLRYGTEILLEDGSLDRRRLGAIIFSNPPEKLWLEQQIHPFVRQCLEADITRAALTPELNPELNPALVPPSTLVLVVPLLIEAQMTDLVTEVWVVACEPEQQLARLIDRDGLSRAEAQARIDSQMPIAQKIPLADVVIHNTTDLTSLHHQVDISYLAIPSSP